MLKSLEFSNKINHLLWTLQYNLEHIFEIVKDCRFWIWYKMFHLGHQQFGLSPCWGTLFTFLINFKKWMLFLGLSDNLIINITVNHHQLCFLLSAPSRICCIFTLVCTNYFGNIFTQSAQNYFSNLFLHWS